jgi:hypothetical protein
LAWEGVRGKRVPGTGATTVDVLIADLASMRPFASHPCCPSASKRAHRRGS